MPSHVAFILGSGARIGQASATLLKQKGYAVAFGSRNPDFDTVKKDGFFPVRVDVSNPESIKDAFTTVGAELGPPNVVIYNAASLNTPPVATDPLSLSIEGFSSSVALGVGVFAAAQQALAAFRSETHKDSPKAFIMTGNALPFGPPPPPLYIGLDIQKTIGARLTHLFSRNYSKENIGFYFASLVSPTGTVPGFDVFVESGRTHAQVYWDLINEKEPQYWDHRFTADGKKLANYEK